MEGRKKIYDNKFYFKYQFGIVEEVAIWQTKLLLDL
jgi:hypothetical protein